MSRLVNKVLNSIFKGRPAYRTLIANKKSFLYQSGWMESKKQNYPCRPDGTPLPWMNYSIIAFLEERLKKDHSLFEYGSGYSTEFYSNLVNDVTSVEHDKNWYDIVCNKLPANAELIFTKEDTDGKYCRSINQTNRKFDIIIIDGKDRVNCIKQGYNSLNETGIILLDDSHRGEYEDGINFLKEKGFKVLNFSGLKPTGNGSADYSKLFYRQNNCVDL